MASAADDPMVKVTLRVAMQPQPLHELRLSAAALARLEGARGTAEATKTKHARTPTKGPRGHRHRSGVEGLWGRGLRAALCNRLARYCPL